MSVSRDPRGIEIAASQMRVDSWAADTIVALHAAGIKAILLKGPVVTKWLYADSPWARSYADVDLMVAPRDQRAAAEVLASLGYERNGVAVAPGDEPHARTFTRASDAACVDLHRVLHGTEAVSAQRVWDAVSSDTEFLRVGGVDVDMPSEYVRALHIVLHVSSSDGPSTKPRLDLVRALQILDLDVWRHATQLARELGIEREVGHRLSLVPEAADLLAALDLPSEESPLYTFQRVATSRDHAPGVLSILMLSAQPNVGARGRYLASKLFPAPQVLRDRYPIAQRGRLGIVVARLRRIVSCIVHFPGAVRGWNRERGR